MHFILINVVFKAIFISFPCIFKRCVFSQFIGVSCPYCNMLSKIKWALSAVFFEPAGLLVITLWIIELRLFFGIWEFTLLRLVVFTVGFGRVNDIAFQFMFSRWQTDWPILIMHGKQFFGLYGLIFYVFSVVVFMLLQQLLPATLIRPY